jgi:very-short-patch-repair endonuclease/formylmethanofuran dehydrogenase subunit E
MFKIDKRIKKTFEKIKEKNKQFSFLWLNQDEFWIQYPKIKKKFKLKFICLKCNNYFERSCYTHLDENYNCPFCANKKMNFREFLKRFLKLKLNYYFYLKFNKSWFEQNYKNSNTKLPLKCKKCKNTVKISLNNLLYQKVKCKYCAREKRSIKNQKITFEDFIKKANKIHNYPKIIYEYNFDKDWWDKNFKGSYRTTRIKIPVICKKHGLFHTTYSQHIIQKSGCPKCNSSKGEKEIIKILSELKINYIHQFKFDDYNYRYDFCIPKIKLLIEYDGIQHFKIIEFFGENNYRKTVNNDIQKFLIAKAFGYNILRIKYNDDIRRKLLSALKVFGLKFKDNNE